MHVAFYLEILKKEGNLGVPNIHRGVIYLFIYLFIYSKKYCVIV